MMLSRALILCLCLIAVPPLSGLAPSAHAQTDRSAAARRALMRDVKTWAIQYRRIDVHEIAASPFDLVVVDYRPDVLFGTEWPFSKSDVALMQRKPDGGRRRVIAYLSVGEAEDYRWYWQRDWNVQEGRPGWIGTENPRWRGNFPVRFWHPDWQKLLFADTASYLDRLIDAGFDGVYLDRIDVYQEFVAERASAERDMVDLLVRLAARAHRRNPLFLVIHQNAEELTSRREVRAAIDAFAKEDLYFGVEHDGRRNPAPAVEYAAKPMRALRRSGIKVLLIEYPLDEHSAAEARARAGAEGFTLLLADRDLAALAPVFPRLPPRQRE